MTAPTARRLVVDGIAKSFGPTRAVAHASLTLEPGTVHTLLGENGSGKSTLVKILGGVHRADAGTIRLGADEVRFRDPAAARRAGVATVFQEVLTVGAQSVYENVWLGSDGIFAVRGRRAERRARAAEVLAELLGTEIDLDAPAAALSLSDRQAVCIARSLVTDPDVLVLDESTAALDIATRDRLFAVLRRLTARGASVLFISHRMDEITEISDTVTVLRSGTTIATVDRADIVPARLLELMTGTDSLVGEDRDPAPPGEVVLQAAGVRLGEERAPFDVTVRAGELVGLAGLEGHGQDAFLKRLAGLHAGPGDVRAHLDGTSVPVTARLGARLGIAYLPRERRGESLFPQMSIRENFALPTLSQDQTLTWWSPARTSRRFRPHAEELRIRMGADTDPISTLSGGNQQKVLMARWLATNPRVLLLNDPTRGVDLGTKRELYALLDRLCRRGLAVVMLSTETDELIELMDRVLVFRDDELAAEIPRAQLNRRSLVSAYFGEAAA